MAKNIFYILLGLFLIPKFASVPNEVKEREKACTLALRCDDSEHSLSEANPDLYEKMFSGEQSTSKAINTQAIRSFSLHGASISKIVKLNPFFGFAHSMKPIKLLHSEEDTNPLSFSINPLKFSCGYYVYNLRHILI